MKKDLLVLFSGGRTSGYMCYWIKRNWSHLYNLHFLYANTGQEHPKTLDFINICDQEMSLDLTWIEADVKEKGVGTSYKVVDYETASRDGRPFEDIVKKYGLPNKDFPHCTREMKIEPAKKWAEDNISKDYDMALGIRVDEPKRLTQAKGQNNKLYPLAHNKPMTKGDIIDWWRNQHFDLQVPEHLGNCMWCWKKSDRKLWTIAKEHPEVFDFPKMLEGKYSKTSNYERKDARVMFRHYRSADDILMESKEPFEVFVENNSHQLTFGFEHDECAEECGSVIF